MTQQTTAINSYDIHQAIRRNSNWLLGWGLINLILPSLSGSFGIMLLFTGAFGYYLTVPALLLVEAIIFIYAAIFNLFVGEVMAIAFSMILLISGIQTIRIYRRYRKIDLKEETSNSKYLKTADFSTKERMAAWQFPTIAFFLTIISWIGFVTTFILVILFFAQSIEVEVPSIPTFLLELFLEMGIWGFAFGLASLLSRYRYKVLSILAILGGLGNLALTVIGSVIA